MFVLQPSLSLKKVIQMHIGYINHTVGIFFKIVFHKTLNFLIFEFLLKFSNHKHI